MSVTAPSKDALLDRQKVLIHNLAGQFSLLVKLAAIPTENVTAEIAASQAFQTKMETQTLITAAEELLMFSRELKELWLFGQLRDLGEGEGEGDIEENAKKVGEMVQALQGAQE